jgi:hypothetical protein
VAVTLNWYCCCSVLLKMTGKEVSFDEQITAIREFIAGLLEEEEDWGEAAKVLSLSHSYPTGFCVVL